MNSNQIVAILLITLLSSFTIAKEANNVSPVETLSPELRVLLSKEMLAIQEGMMAIIPAYSAGNNLEIANIAGQIQDSFILKQSLSKKQHHELHTKLPEKFLELDEQFHYNAGKLKDAAENNQEELIGFYFTQLSESCAGCHRQFAQHQFPHLKEPHVK